jgi:hypothetical protein
MNSPQSHRDTEKSEFMTFFLQLRLTDWLIERQEKVSSVSLCLCGELLFSCGAAL